MKKKPLKKQLHLNILTVRRQAGQKSRGILSAGQFYFFCALGRNGITSRKMEGDGATPLAAMRILGGFKKNETQIIPGSYFRLKTIRTNDGWCDESFDANYNRPIRFPFKKSAEHMQRIDNLYDIGYILDWNYTCRSMNRGSAIFMHLIRENYSPTQGCIALSRKDMQRIMPYIGRYTKICVIR